MLRSDGYCQDRVRNETFRMTRSMSTFLEAGSIKHVGGGLVNGTHSTNYEDISFHVAAEGNSPVFAVSDQGATWAD
jgi:hypothetical protein